MRRLISPALIFALSMFITPCSHAAVLQEGDHSDQVEQVQTALISMGLLDGSADGYYGVGTAEAIKNFQASVGLPADGVCGDQTMSMLLGGGVSEGSGDGYAIKLGSRGDDVAEVQNILIAMGYMSGNADGVCGSGTVEAIRQFQSSVGIEADGVAGAHTLDMLAEAAQNFERGQTSSVVSRMTPAPSISKSENAKKSSDEVYAAIGSVVKPGMHGEGVVDVQKKLIAQGYLKGSADGECGSATVAAIKKFQASVGLPADGVCGLMTYAALEDAAYNTSDTTWDDYTDYESEQSYDQGYGRSIYVDATAYSAYDPGCGSYTARGSYLRRGIIAVDPSVIPLGTRVYIPGYGEAIADDTGGAIIGNRIDIAFDSHEEAIYFGRQQLEIYIIE